MNIYKHHHGISGKEYLQVGVVTETYPPEVNGVARTLKRIVKQLAERGHQVHLIRPRQGSHDNKIQNHLTSLTLVAGIPVPGYAGIQGGFPAYFKLLKAWRKYKPDILYVATEGPLGFAAIKAARKLKIPVISGFHTNFHSYSRHYRLGLFKHLIMKYMRYLHNQTASTLVPTEELSQQLQAVGFNNLNVLGRGVDLKKFSPSHRSTDLRKEWGVEENDPVVLYVGRLAQEKNLNLAIDAFEKMYQVNPRARFVLVGEGPIGDELMQEERDNMIFVGVKTGKDLTRHYASADIFLFPSKTETFGNVTLEAMASGLAIVAFDYAAGRQVGRHEHNGLFIPLTKEHLFSEQAIRLVQEPELVKKLRTQARLNMQDHQWKRIHDRFESLLYNYLNKSDRQNSSDTQEAHHVQS